MKKVEPKTISEIIEKLMISCITAVLEQQQKSIRVPDLKTLEEVHDEYCKYLKFAKKETLRLLKMKIKI